MGSIFRQYCESALRALHAQSDAAAVVKHGPSLGAIRERAIHDLLEQHLPSMVRIISGQIFDSKDARSTQQDVILTLKNVPRLPFASGFDMVYAEGVVATIEIKSDLNAPMLKSIGEGIESVRKLQPNLWGSSSMMVNHNWPQTKILSGVATFKGSSFATLMSVLTVLPEECRPDFILDLSQGILIQNHGLIVPKQGSDPYVIYPDPALGFMFFLTFLTEITGTLSSRGVNWRAYLS